jgi:hypothetical protein
VQFSKLSSPMFYQLSTMSSYNTRVPATSLILRLKSHQLLSYSYQSANMPRPGALSKETAKSQLTQEESRGPNCKPTKMDFSWLEMAPTAPPLTSSGAGRCLSTFMPEIEHAGQPGRVLFLSFPFLSFCFALFSFLRFASLPFQAKSSPSSSSHLVFRLET